MVERKKRHHTETIPRRSWWMRWMWWRQHTTPTKTHPNALWPRRDVLLLGLRASLLLPFGAVACAPAPPKETEEERLRKEREKQCHPTSTQDNPTELPSFAESLTQNETLFSLGVQAGLMTETKTMLWTFCEDNQPKELRVWRPSNKDKHVLLVFQKDLQPKEGFFHHTVENLAPGQKYEYAFFQKDGEKLSTRSRIGTFQTAFPKDCLQPLTIAATSCTHVERYPDLKALKWMAKQDIHLTCHLGDMSYNDGANTKEEFQQKWKKTLQTPGYPELLSHAGMYATWDDHESTDNSKLYTKPPEFRALAKDLYLQHVAQPQNQKDKRFWGNYRWGKSVEFFVLDCRGERIPDENIYISKEQMSWLKQALKDSPCHFKVLLNSVPIIQWPPLWKVAAGDRWEGFPQQREELLNHIVEQKIPNVWFLGGDYHIGVVARIEKEGPRSHMWEIMVGPGGNKPPAILDSLLKNLGTNQNAIAPKDQFSHFEGQVAATIITFDPIEDHVHVKFVEPNTEKIVFDQKLKQNKPT